MPTPTSLRRVRLSASPATGLVGMKENSFLGWFFDCLGFLPLSSERCGVPRGELLDAREGCFIVYIISMFCFVLSYAAPKVLTSLLLVPQHKGFPLIHGSLQHRRTGSVVVGSRAADRFRSSPLNYRSRGLLFDVARSSLTLPASSTPLQSRSLGRSLAWRDVLWWCAVFARAVF